MDDWFAYFNSDCYCGAVIAIRITSDFTQMPDKITTTTTYAASVGAVIFGLTVNEFAAVVGLIVATLTFFLNAWFKWQHLKLAIKKAKEKQELKEEDIDGH